MTDRTLTDPAVAAWAYWVPKDVTDPRAWEDAIACSEQRSRFAVADGASSAYRARDWAAALTNTYISDTALPPFIGNDDDRASFRAWFARQADRWNHDATPSQSWYEADAADIGSAATFLGLRFAVLDQDIVWQAVAVGDSCLFQIRAAQLHALFPASATAAFTHRPNLVPTNLQRLGPALDAMEITYGTAQPGDVFFLASDAVSEWLLAQAAGDPSTWERLSARFDAVQFRSLILDLRTIDAIKRDDVSFLVLRVLGRRQPAKPAKSRLAHAG